MKLVVVPTKGLNVEHRTSNIEHRMMMTLRFIDFKLDGLAACSKPSALSAKPKSDSESNFKKEMHFARSRSIDRIHYSMLNVQCSMFDVHPFLPRSNWPLSGVSGPPSAEHPKPETFLPLVYISAIVTLPGPLNVRVYGSVN